MAFLDTRSNGSCVIRLVETDTVSVLVLEKCDGKSHFRPRSSVEMNYPSLEVYNALGHTLGSMVRL